MGWLWLIRSLFKWQTKWVLALCEICLHVDWEVLREWKKPFNRSGKASQKKNLLALKLFTAGMKSFYRWGEKSAINRSMMCFYLATNASIVLVKNWEMIDFNPTFWVLLIQHCNSKKEMRLFWVVLLDHNPRDKFWKKSNLSYKLSWRYKSKGTKWHEKPSVSTWKKLISDHYYFF